MNEESQSRQSLLDFPCEFPIKALGRASPDLVQTVLAIVRKHAPETQANQIRLRSSAKGTYDAITITIEAKSKDQLDAIYLDLTASPVILMAL